MSRCDRCDMQPCQCAAAKADDARQRAEARWDDTQVGPIAAEFPGTCPECSDPIEVGQPIARRGERRWHHEECLS